MKRQVLSSPRKRERIRYDTFLFNVVFFEVNKDIEYHSMGRQHSLLLISTSLYTVVLLSSAVPHGAVVIILGAFVILCRVFLLFA